MSVLPIAWHSSASTGRIFMKLDIEVFFFPKCVEKIEFLQEKRVLHIKTNVHL
jgi:hypothetical protein